MPATLTPDLLAHLAAVRDAAGEPDDVDLGSLADHLEEAGDADRAELIRVQVELGRCPTRLPQAWQPRGCNCGRTDCHWCPLHWREARLSVDNPAWLSVQCPECKGEGWVPGGNRDSRVRGCELCGGVYLRNGTGDLLANAKPTIARGFVTVTLPSALCWQRRCEVCGTSRWGRGDGCIHCDGACGPKVKYFPHPVLAAVLDSPVGPWVRRVVVSDREPMDNSAASFDGESWDWWDAEHFRDSDRPCKLPRAVFVEVAKIVDPGGVVSQYHYTESPTAEAAVDALARVVPLWSRLLMDKL